jgi:hypothetical protein
MISFLRVKKTKKIRKKTGKAITRAIYMEKSHKMGRVITEKAINIKKPVLVCGKHSSGKTRWLRKFYENAKEVWSKQDGTPLFFDANHSLTEWKDQDQVIDWWNSQNSDKKWQRLSGHKKETLLIDYASKVWTVVFIDNADKLHGRKLDIVKNIVQSSQSRIWIASAMAENRIGPSLREILLKSSPQKFCLSSAVSYDATNVLIISCCVILIMIGNIEAAMMVGMFRIMRGGQSSTKQQ